MVRETPRCLASIRTLQCVLPSPGRVFNVVSRIFCSSSGVNTLGPALPLANPVTAAIPFLAKAARKRQDGGSRQVQLPRDGLIGDALMSEQQKAAAQRDFLRGIAVANQCFQFPFLLGIHC